MSTAPTQNWYAFIKKKEVLSSTVVAVIAGVGAFLSRFYEHGDYCNPNCQLWITGAAFKYVISLILLLIIELIRIRIIPYSGDTRSIQKLLEMMDVFGVIWFTVGNLLIFASTNECQIHQPICFSLTVTIIVTLYITYIYPYIKRRILRSYRRMYGISDSLSTSQHDESDSNNLNLSSSRSGGVYNRTSHSHQEITDDEENYWKEWLASYDCITMSYHTYYNQKLGKKRYDNKVNTFNNNPIQNSTATATTTNVSTTSNVSTQISHNNITTQCSICLDYFISNGLVDVIVDKIDTDLDHQKNLSTTNLYDDNNNHQIKHIKHNDKDLSNISINNDQTELDNVTDITNTNIYTNSHKKNNLCIQSKDATSSRIVPVLDDNSKSPHNNLQIENKNTILMTLSTNNVTTNNINNKDNHTDQERSRSYTFGIDKNDLYIDSNNDTDDIIVVCFPCPARHIFHQSCLIQWLHTSATTSYQSYASSTRISSYIHHNEYIHVTCPYCRESAVKLDGNTTIMSGVNSIMNEV